MRFSVLILFIYRWCFDSYLNKTCLFVAIIDYCSLLRSNNIFKNWSKDFISLMFSCFHFLLLGTCATCITVVYFVFTLSLSIMKINTFHYIILKKKKAFQVVFIGILPCNKYKKKKIQKIDAQRLASE